MTEGLIRKEIVKEDDKEKTIYHYVDGENDIDIKSRETYKKKDIQIHYPFYIDRKTNEAKPKYRNIKFIIFEGFRNKIPQGFLKSPERGGYGATKQLKPLIRFLDALSYITILEISKNRKTEIKNNSLIINYKDLEIVRKYLNTQFKNFNETNRVAINNFLCLFLPQKFSKIKKKYSKGYLTNLFHEYEDLLNNLSIEDKNTLLSAFEKLSVTKREIFEKKQLVQTREKIEIIYIENVQKTFEKLLSSKRINEEKWQDFFKNNSWIFSQLFAYPTVLIKDKAYVGGKTIYNIEGKIVDYLYKNKLTKNSALIEIKTHTSRLLSKKPYRGEDVFFLDKNLSGAINQALDQKHTYLRDFKSTLVEGEEYESFDPKCLIIIGKISSLTKKQLKSFELFRRGLKDIEIITFDELYEKIKSILEIFKKDETTN